MSVALPKNNESQSARSRAVDVERAVAQWIFKGELTAGQKLTEQEVALRLGVSRGPVREAFRALEDLGLVQIEQNRGAFVRKIDLDEAIEIHDVYSALEELATRTAARRLLRQTNRPTPVLGRIDGRRGGSRRSRSILLS